MRLIVLSLLGVLVAMSPGPAAEEVPPPAAVTQDAAATKATVEQILIPVWAAPADHAETWKPSWGSLGDGEVFREIRALSKEGLVQNAGQPPPKLRILREFFAPARDATNPRFLGHYVFIVECVKSDLKHVVSGLSK